MFRHARRIQETGSETLVSLDDLLFNFISDITFVFILQIQFRISCDLEAISSLYRCTWKNKGKIFFNDIINKNDITDAIGLGIEKTRELIGRNINDECSFFFFLLQHGRDI